MKVRAIKRQRNDLAEHLRPFLPDPAHVTVGNEYDVHAVVFFNWVKYLQPKQAVQSPGVAYLQIVDDLRYPAWYPSALFEVFDGTIPRDWQFNLFPDNDTKGPAVVIGPHFLTHSEGAYQAMVELEADQVNQFWKRVDSWSEGGKE